MNLPHADLALIEQAKVADYLPDPEHPENGGKVGFFLALGFRQEEWPKLATALRRAAADHPVAKKMVSPHGEKYVLEGPLETPGGKKTTVRAVWIIDAGLAVPRLVTAYPGGHDDAL
jgi:hypothetical protein